jgi:prepilin-type N-terminal cleavage/methylation domain-containing protein
MQATTIQRPRGPSRAARRRALRGISLVELLIVMAILGALLAFGVPAVGKMLRRMECASGLSGMARVLNSARLAAIKGVSGATAATPTTPAVPPAPVVVMIEKGGPKDDQIRVWSFIDTNQSYNFTTGERILDDIVFPRTLVFWKHGDGDVAKGDIDKAVFFDTYTPPVSIAGEPTGDALTDRIVFLPNGGIVRPQEEKDSVPPTPTGGRGIYFADNKGLNYFRVTIYGDTVARAVSEKWIDDTSGYATTAWSWK